MNILITGSHGFLGRHYVKYLTDLGHKVLGIDNLSNGRRLENWPKHLLPNSNFNSVYADILEYLPDQEFDLVIHCAGIIGGRQVIDFDPVQHVKSMEIDAKFAQWFVKTKQKKLLYLSSSASYPVSKQTPAFEHIHLEESDQNLSNDMLGVPDMMYGWSKLSGEVMFKMLSKSYKFDVLCIRPFSGYGEDQGDEYPMTAITKRALRREDPLTVWGSGMQGRDFIYVDDLVSLSFEQVQKTSGYDCLNLCSSDITTFIQLAKKIASIVGYSPQVSGLKDMPEGVKNRRGSNVKMKQLNLIPKYDLDSGLRRVVDFHKGEF